MTTETKPKKNPDYSMSATITNPPEVKVKLNLFYQQEAEREELRGKLEATELFKEWVEACGRAADAKEDVIKAVKEYGSYQDTENGVYAVKQTSQSKHYHAEPFIENFDKYAPAVIENSVNVKALEGLVKGKLITEEQLRAAGVLTTTDTYRFIVK